MPPKPGTRHGWGVKTHDEMPHSDGLRQHHKKPELVVCPLCGSLKDRFLLVDVSALPESLTKGQKWACDGCWTGWERRQVLLPDGREFDESIMYELMGAPQSMVTEVADCVAIRKAHLKKPQQ